MTDHATRSVRIGRIYVGLRSTAMRPNNAVASDGLRTYADDTSIFVDGSDVQATVMKANTLFV